MALRRSIAQSAACLANSSAVCDTRANHLLPCWVRLVACASGDNWKTSAGFVTSIIACVSALVEPPTTAMTLSEVIMRAAACAALPGLPAESSLMISIFNAPSAPRLASCSSAKRAPSSVSVP